MSSVWEFLGRRQGGKRLTTADLVTYLYLLLGTVVMFGPVVWLILSSFKPIEGLYEFPPTFLPYRQQTVLVPGYDEPLPLYEVTLEDGTVRRLAQISRVGLVARMIDPAAPEAKPLQVKIDQRRPVRKVVFNLDNYTGAIKSFPFLTYLRNTVFVTVVATLFTLLFNSMAAFGLSKYRFAGRDAIFLVMISTLMVPVSVILIPAFLVISKVGWSNNLWGLIIPGAATPTGVFLLRQYMLTIPDELMDSARIDGASEWRIYWQIILPLAAPALAVLTIFSVMWRWNDFLWPLIVLSKSELFTLQVGLNAFQGDLNVQWHYILAMTVLTLLPISVVFAFLQKYITTGIATTGMK
jgi:alpha-1,4-digalacturonate transport system permease protein